MLAAGVVHPHLDVRGRAPFFAPTSWALSGLDLTAVLPASEASRRCDTPRLYPVQRRN